MDDHTSTFVRHVPCPDCGSSDGCSLFSDGHTYCHVCSKTRQGTQSQPTERRRVAGNLIHDLEFKDLPSRLIDEETCRKFGYGIGSMKDKPCQVANYFNAEGTKVV